MAPKEELEIGRSFVELLRQNEFETIEQVLVPELQTSETRTRLEIAASAFPLAEPRATRLVGVDIRREDKRATYNFTFEYTYADAWVITNAAFRRDADGIRVVGISGYRTLVSPETLNGFNFQGKTLLHFLTLLLVVGVPVFIVVTLFAAVRARLGIGQWLWYVFIALGLGAFQLNWTTGASQFAPLNVYVLGAAYTKVGFGPWVLTVAVPLGAVMFWVKRKQLTRSRPTVADSAPEAKA